MPITYLHQSDTTTQKIEASHPGNRGKTVIRTGWTDGGRHRAVECSDGTFERRFTPYHRAPSEECGWILFDGTGADWS